MPAGSSVHAGKPLRITPEILWAGVWALVALALVGYGFKRLYPGDLTNPDAMDFAQIARNIALGHGYATSILRPLALSGLVTPDHGASVMTPDVSRAPLYPFVLMLAFIAHGGHGGGNVVVLTSLFFFLLSAGAVFLLAKTLFPTEGQPWPALLSVGLYVLGGDALGYATEGLPVSLTALLLSLFLIALFRSHETGRTAVSGWQAAGVGMLLGLCYLAQFSLLVLAVPTLVYIFATRAPSRAWQGVGFCAAGFFIVTLPWLARMAIVTHGNPFFSLLQYGIMADTAEYPGQSSIYRSVLPADTPFSFFFLHFPEMVVKFGRGIVYYETHLPEAFPVLVAAPALVSLLWRYSDLRVVILRGYVAVSLLLLALVSTVFAPSIQMLAPFAPVVTVLGVGFVFQLMARQQWRAVSQRLVLWSWGILAGAGLFGALIGHPGAKLNPIQAGISMLAGPEYLSPHDPRDLSALDVAVLAGCRDGRVLKEIRDGAVITDTPWEVTWRTGIPAIWLPRDNQAYEAVVKQSEGGGPDGVAANSLLLTPNIAAYAADGEAAPWIAWARDPILAEHKRELRTIAAMPKDLQRKIAVARRLVTEGRLTVHMPDGGRRPMTLAELDTQIAVAKAALPSAVAKSKAGVQAQYDQTFGPISEIIDDFETSPNVLEQQESDNAPSTLFLRRDFLTALELQQEASQ